MKCTLLLSAGGCSALEVDGRVVSRGAARGGACGYERAPRPALVTHDAHIVCLGRPTRTISKGKISYAVGSRPGGAPPAVLAPDIKLELKPAVGAGGRLGCGCATVRRRNGVKSGH
ncbi:hypothetical protein EVAR_18817_1 [Eumeta japonica]|uniref:Uncharacterized protein n=1 Tax=Eumeta variegata TaxID=151549 RepID=A0A4C1UNB9_EUMVA|nr:hypothetical protein EVAR_18817_1 [Eumeta japonica]